jgi:hypothetical protein
MAIFHPLTTTYIGRKHAKSLLVLKKKLQKALETALSG